MTDETNEQERRLDRLEHRVEKNEAIANEDKETRRAEMTAMKSDLAESLARNEAATKEAAARAEAASKDAATRAEAASKDGLARFEAVVAADRVAAERRDKDLHKFISVMFFGATGLIIASVGVATAILGFLL